MAAMHADAFQGCATRDLASGAQFTVWCLRTRLVCKRKGDDPRPRIDHGFQVADVPEAARDFDQIFDWLDGAAVRPVAIGCFCCKQVSPDEAQVLAALAAAQAGDRAGCERGLGSLLSAVAAHEATRAAMRLAHALNAVDLPVGVDRERAPRAAVPKAANDPPGTARSWPAATAPGSAAVH
ncbi:hypothetical protein CKO28_21085 [Rhodovibrio sodomensis]|uniref:Uncharacterized protein n=1 Tax=Rhodovibrio sodomensis TaxID=1088 RepID=A0ABS1DKR2_9PROT|nr:hypothetical protein [Rhodovibrio sodomensis]MBK1670522.1 hypothetical protein [Rhodovibrio sodomensis]